MKKPTTLGLILGMIFYLFILPLILSAQAVLPDVEQNLKETGEKMIAATLAGDYLSLLDYHAKDVVIMPDFRPAISGKKALEAQYKEDMKMGLKHHSFTGTVEKRWQHGDEVFERGTFGMAVSSKKDKRPAAYYGSYFQIWQKQSDGTFKISFIIWNLDFNPFESH